mgnify:CR=1 FL=1
MTEFEVFVATLNSFGGGEILALTAIEAIHEFFPNNKIVVKTIDIPRVPELYKIFNDKVQILKYVEWRPLGIIPVTNLNEYSIYRTLPYLSILEYSIRTFFNTRNKVIINLFADTYSIPAHICYIHFPYFIIRRSGYSALRDYIRKILSIRLLNACKIILTNSAFTKTILCYASKDVCDKSFVLHPPLTIKPMDEETFYSTLCHRKPLILTISRISREKKLEYVIEIGKLMPEADFIIIGSLRDENYYMELVEKAEKCDNVKIYINLPRDQLFSLMRKAMIYLHTMPLEHFGISVLEAMSQGLVPVVHRSGGPWTDILNYTEGKWGFSYTSIMEAAMKIKALINNIDFYKRIALNAIERSKNFTEEKFKMEFAKIVNKFLKVL